MKRLSWKYVAGLIDGEGCFDVQLINNKQYPGRPYISPRIRVSLSAPGKDLVYILKNNYGGYVETRKRPPTSTWKDVYTWGLTGKRARPFLQNIKNHLIIKKEQAKLLIFLIDNLMGKWIDNDVRTFLRDELKAMKRDHQRLSDKATKLLLEKYKKNKWAYKYSSCVKCGSTRYPHQAHGLCTRCYMRNYNNKLVDAIV